ncbi:hypothetical protein I3842_09G073700 [Carya illinoinensis]|uniref:Transposase n=1 Tax=Carya illinoinensis TaxID=32201 RepID=A0A922J6B4_CARIL|nr:hypothetical protein I3842_09G073700 [Carya illinoinensis]
MVRSIKFRGGRVRHGRVALNSSPVQAALPPRTVLRDEPESNDSTQDVGALVPQEVLGGNQVGEKPSTTDPHSKKRGRGPTKGTLFERMRKVGKIPLVIQEGHRGPSCENAAIFTGRLTEMIKVHVDMRHASWSFVPEAEKQELIDRVRADFVLDWSRDNHREMVETHLADKYNAYHYALHKVYLKYASHEEALRGGTDKVEKAVWEKLCERWASATFKEKSRRNSSNRQKLKVKHTGGRKSFIQILEEKRESAQNMVEFYKETHFSTRKGKFINAATEHNYVSVPKLNFICFYRLKRCLSTACFSFVKHFQNVMMERLAEKDTEDDVEEAAETIFKEVLGYRSGYSVGLGHMVIPEPTPSMKNSRAFILLAEENQRHKSDAEIYKNKLDAMMGDIAELRRNFSEHEKLLMSYRSTDGNINGSESHGETQRDA